jgi:hypothetical protein
LGFPGDNLGGGMPGGAGGIQNPFRMPQGVAGDAPVNLAIQLVDGLQANGDSDSHAAILPLLRVYVKSLRIIALGSRPIAMRSWPHIGGNWRRDRSRTGLAETGKLSSRQAIGRPALAGNPFGSSFGKKAQTELGST